VRLICAAAALTVTTGATVALAPAAQAAQAVVADYTIVIDAPAIHVVTSTHRHLSLSLSSLAYVTSEGRSQGANITLTASKGTSESHAWTVPLPGDHYSVKERSGKGSMSDKHLAKSFGSLNLKVLHAGKERTVTCGGATSKTYPSKISGTMSLVTKSTGSHKWGTLKGKVVFDHTTLKVIPEGDLPCVDQTCPSLGISYQDGNAGASLDVTGTSEGKRELITFFRKVQLSSSTDLNDSVTRTDLFIGRTKRPKLHLGSNTSTLTITGTGDITGKLSMSSRSDYTYTCQKESVTAHSASVTSQGFEAHEQVFGILRPPSSSSLPSFSIAKETAQ
jgi:hypothetical protein